MWCKGPLINYREGGATKGENRLKLFAPPPPLKKGEKVLHSWISLTIMGFQWQLWVSNGDYGFSMAIIDFVAMIMEFYWEYFLCVQLFYLAIIGYYS